MGTFVAVPKAVSDGVGTAVLHLGGTTGTHSISRHSGIGRDRTVETTSVDEFLSAAYWPRVNVIKMDIEGAEPEALDGMRGLFARTQALDLLFGECPKAC